MIVHVDTGALTLTVDGVVTPCVIGRGGAIDAAAKREGDGCTPKGSFSLREAFLRPDRVAAVTTALPWRWLRRDDGWSDDPADPAYNRNVTHPHAFSAEQMWRDDGLYDAVVVLGYNDAPPVPGRGSAIFLHCTAPDRHPTAGCIAIDREALVVLLPFLSTADSIAIS